MIRILRNFYSSINFQKNLKENALLISVHSLILIYIYFFLSGTRFHYITIDVLNYMDQFFNQHGYFQYQAVSHESYFYRIFIHQTIRFFETIKSLQNLNFFFFIIIFTQVTLFLKKAHSKYIAYIYLLITIVNVYSYTYLMVIERDVLFGLQILGYISLVNYSLNQPNHNLKHYFILSIYTVFTCLNRLEGYLVLLSFFLMNLKYELSLKLKLITLTIISVFILSFNYLIINHETKRLREEYKATIFESPVEHILLKKYMHNEKLSKNENKFILNEEDRNKLLDINKKLDIILNNPGLYFDYCWYKFKSSITNNRVIALHNNQSIKEYQAEQTEVSRSNKYFYQQLSLYEKEIHPGVLKFKLQLDSFYQQSNLFYLFTQASSIILSLILFLFCLFSKQFIISLNFIMIIIMSIGVILFAPTANTKYHYFLIFINPYLWTQLFIKVKLLAIRRV